MTTKEKKKAVHMFQMGVYSSPVEVSKQKNDQGFITYELSNVVYPYRKGNINLDWFELFLPKEKQNNYPR